jgi:hypothetical protein
MCSCSSDLAIRPLGSSAGLVPIPPPPRRGFSSRPHYPCGSKKLTLPRQTPRKQTTTDRPSAVPNHPPTPSPPPTPPLTPPPTPRSSTRLYFGAPGRALYPVLPLAFVVVGSDAALIFLPPTPRIFTELDQTCGPAGGKTPMAKALKSGGVQINRRSRRTERM